MTNCNRSAAYFSSLKSKKIECNFSGGEITSDGGVILLREVDKKIGLTEKVAKLIPDHRNQSYTTHSILQMVRQRVYGIVFVYRNEFEIWFSTSSAANDFETRLNLPTHSR